MGIVGHVFCFVYYEFSCFSRKKITISRKTSEHNPEWKPEKTFSFFKGIGELGTSLGFFISGFIGAPLCYYLWVGIIVYSAILTILADFYSKGCMPIHIGHISERYGLFVIILLGESMAGIALLLKEHTTTEMIFMGWLAFLGASSIWWLYFGVRLFQST